MSKDKNIIIVGGLSAMAVGAYLLAKKPAGLEPPPPGPPPPPPVDLANLYGVIADDKTGMPVIGATLTFYQPETPKYTTQTNEWGFFQILGMVDGVMAEYAIEAGGYETLTGSVIPQGNHELNFTMKWILEEREVPKFLSADFPSQIESGESFPFSVSLQLPYVGDRTAYSCRLRFTRSEWHADNFGLWWEFMPWDAYQLVADKYKYFDNWVIPFDQAGVWTAIGRMDALTEIGHKWNRHMVPAPPGIYDVSLWILRYQILDISPEGRMETDTDADFGLLHIGTAEVI